MAALPSIFQTRIELSSTCEGHSRGYKKLRVFKLNLFPIQLKRIRSGEALDTSAGDDNDYAAAAAADRRKPRRASMQPLEEVTENDSR